MTADLAALERVLSRTAWWMRLQRGLYAGAWGLVAGSLLWVALSRVAALPGAACAGALLGVAWPLSRERIAAQVDAVYRLDGRLRAALDLTRLPGAQRSAFERAALHDAAEHAARVSVRVAAPLRRPSTPLSLALLCSIGLWLGMPTPSQPLRAPAASATRETSALPLLARDELLALQRDEPSGQLTSPERAEYEALLGAVESALPPAALIARALSLEHALVAGEQTSERDRAALRALASELQRTSPVLATALRDDPREAAAQLRQLSARLRGGAFSAQEKQQLAAALEQARARARERMAALEEESLLARRSHGEDGAEPSLLKRRREPERELASLQRERAEPLSRELQQLSRELAQAGDALSQEGGEQAAADAMERASEALDQHRQESQRSEPQRSLREAVAQLRELLQRRALSARTAARAQDAGADGEEQASERGQRFSERARGEPQSRGGEATGESESGERETMVSAERRQLQQVQTVERVSTSGGPGHDATRGPPTPRPAARYRDARLEGAEGAGPVRSQVIRGAAEGGFASLGYRKVYADYREHAEASLEQTEVPAGARFHVRRYFQLVRPREGQDRHD